jgi:hypothetical protein
MSFSEDLSAVWGAAYFMAARRRSLPNERTLVTWRMGSGGAKLGPGAVGLGDASDAVLFTDAEEVAVRSPKEGSMPRAISEVSWNQIGLIRAGRAFGAEASSGGTWWDSITVGGSMPTTYLYWGTSSDGRVSERNPRSDPLSSADETDPGSTHQLDVAAPFRLVVI